MPQLGSDRIRGELQAQHAVVGGTDANHLVRITQALRDEMDQPSGRRNIVVVLMVVAHCELAAADVDELRLFQCAGANDTLECSVDGVVITNDRTVRHSQRRHLQHHPAALTLAVNLLGKLVAVKQAKPGRQQQQQHQEVQAKHPRNQRLGQQAKNGGHGAPAQGGLVQGLGRGLEKPAVRRIVCGAGGHKNGIYW